MSIQITPLHPILSVKRRLDEATVAVAKKAKVDGAPRLTSTTIQKKYLPMIAEKTKSVEGRIDSGMFAKIKVGEQIQFFCCKEKVRCTVIFVNRYPSFEEMLKSEGVSKCLPDVESMEKSDRNLQKNTDLSRTRRKLWRCCAWPPGFMESNSRKKSITRV